jgi:regulator of RNase E activity RraA
MNNPVEDCPIAEDIVERLQSISSGTLTTQLFRRGLRQCFLVGIKPINPAAALFAGEAFTMRLIPAREDIDTLATLTPYPNPQNLQWEAAERIQKGQVLVIDSRSDTRAGVGGDLLLTRMMSKGVAAVVTDGALRDGAAIASMNFPAFSREVTATSRLSFHHTADLQVPISCAGVAVYPGDIIVGDPYGVTIVPRRYAAAIAEEGLAQDEMESYLAFRIASGESLYGVYPPTEQIRADFNLWKRSGARAEDVSRIRANAAECE